MEIIYNTRIFLIQKHFSHIYKKRKQVSRCFCSNIISEAKFNLSAHPKPVEFRLTKKLLVLSNNLKKKYIEQKVLQVSNYRIFSKQYDGKVIIGFEWNLRIFLKETNACLLKTKTKDTSVSYFFSVCFTTFRNINVNQGSSSLKIAMEVR